MNKINARGTKIKQSEHIYALKVRTESNGLGILKTLIVLLLIVLQVSVLLLSYLYFMYAFTWFFTLSLILTLTTCIHVLSSKNHGQAKATWVLFLLVCFSFGYIIYFLSDEHVLFASSKKKYNKLLKETEAFKSKNEIFDDCKSEIKNSCDYLFNAGKFKAYTDSKTTYFSSGAQLFDNIYDDIKKAKKFIFIEYFIIADGVLLNRLLNVLKQKAKDGVEVKIIYDDMGSHNTLKTKTKKDIIKSGIKLQCFNRLVPVFNIALNLRNHRKIVSIDGKIAYTGGANLADEYTNEKRMHGYWKDCGIKIEGKASDNLTLAFLEEWKFLTNENIDFSNYLYQTKKIESTGVIVPFVSGPNYPYSIAQNIIVNQIANAKEKLYIMSPYFIPDETITNMLINKAKAGVDVRIVLPDVADKKFVYIVSRNNAEKLLDYGIKVYTMTSSFVHSKIILNENSAVVGSINIDLRSFYQQFESAVFTSEPPVLKSIEDDFIYTFERSCNLTHKDKKRNHFAYRLLAGIFNLISPFM